LTPLVGRQEGHPACKQETRVLADPEIWHFPLTLLVVLTTAITAAAAAAAATTTTTRVVRVLFKL